MTNFMRKVGSGTDYRTRNTVTATIRRLADGTRTAEEVATAAGISVTHVYRAAYAAKKAGRPLKFTRSTKKQQARSKRTDATIRRLANGKRTAAEVAASAGISVTRVYHAAHAAKKAGHPLKFARSKGGESQTGRNAAIVECIRQGSTLQEQGDKYGISRQAVQQIVLRHGVHASALRRAKSIRRARLAKQEKERSKREKLRARHILEKSLIKMKLSGFTYKEISARAGVSRTILSEVFHANKVTQPQVRRDLATRTMIATRWSEGEDTERLAAEFNTTVGYVRTMSRGLGYRRRGARARKKQQANEPE